MLTEINLKMKVSNLRSKQRQMQRALHSIAFPAYNQKVLTEGCDRAEDLKKPLL